jgi:hypothetical protein
MKQDAKRKLKAMKKAQKSSISFADDETNHNRKFKGEEKRYGKTYNITHVPRSSVKCWLIIVHTLDRGFFLTLCL